MTLRYAYVYFILLGLLPACRKDTFAPDPDDHRLPEYSETGSNQGGALLNGQGWRLYVPKGLLSQREAFVVEAEADSIRLFLDGDMLPKTNPAQRQELWFTLRRSSSAPFRLDSLLHLHNRRFVLDGQRRLAHMGSYGVYDGYRASRGELYVRCVQKKVTPNSAGNGQPYVEYILSGTFHFTARSRTDSVQVTEGRFDHRITRLGFR